MTKLGQQSFSLILSHEDGIILLNSISVKWIFLSKISESCDTFKLADRLKIAFNF